MWFKRIINLINENEIEDGIYHKSEAALEQCLDTFEEKALETIFDFIKKEDTSDFIRANLIKLLGRMPIQLLDLDILKEIFVLGLSSDSVKVRDSVIDAIDILEIFEFKELLVNHKEYCAWLNQYKGKVINKLK